MFDLSRLKSIKGVKSHFLRSEAEESGGINLGGTAACVVFRKEEEIRHARGNQHERTKR